MYNDVSVHFLRLVHLCSLCMVAKYFETCLYIRHQIYG